MAQDWKLKPSNFGRQMYVNKAEEDGFRWCHIRVTWGYCPINCKTVPQFIALIRKVLPRIKPEIVEFTIITKSSYNQGFTLARVDIALTPEEIHKFKAAGFHITRREQDYYYA